MFGNPNNPFLNNYQNNQYATPFNGFMQPNQPAQFNGYNQQSALQQFQNQPPVNTNKIYVTSIEDAKNKPLAPNSDFIFLDNDKPLIYRKTVDATGKMEIQTFKIVPYEEKQESKQDIDLSNFVLVKDFNALKSDLEQIKDSLSKTTQHQTYQASKAQSTPLNGTSVK